MSDIKVARRI